MASGPLALQPHCCIVGTPRCDARSNVVYGWVAQLAEQWTENPRVGGSIPPPAIPLKTPRVQEIFSKNIPCRVYTVPLPSPEIDRLSHLPPARAPPPAAVPGLSKRPYPTDA